MVSSRRLGGGDAESRLRGEGDLLTEDVYRLLRTGDLERESLLDEGDLEYLESLLSLE